MRIGCAIAANIAGRNSGRAEQAYAEMREILTYSAVCSEYVVNVGVNVSGGPKPFGEVEFDGLQDNAGRQSIGLDVDRGFDVDRRTANRKTANGKMT